MRSNGHKKITRILVVALAAVIATVSLSGCSLLLRLFDSSYADFTRSTLNLSVGESYDLSDIIDSDTNAYRLSVSPSSVASISGKVLTAKSEGVATVTAETSRYYSTLKVIVTAKEEDALSVSYEGDIVQRMGVASAVVFTPEPRGAVVDSVIDWYVDGEKVISQSATKKFEYTPSSAGVHEVYAKSGDVSSETIEIRVYYDVDIVGTYEGELNQSAESAEPIVFSVTVAANANNPEPYAVWYVDGEPTDRHELTYSYLPTVGMHTVRAVANGVDVLFDGNASVTVSCSGSVTPDAPTIEFDNLYPHVYIRYDVVGDAAVELTAPNGKVTEILQTDAQYSGKFNDGVFDADGLMDICASGATRGRYKVRVRSLGDGDLIKASDYGEALMFSQLPSAAKTFLSSRYNDRDHYVTSEEEYANLLEYCVLSRNKTANALVGFDCYIAFDLKSKDDLWNDAFHVAATSGYYSDISVELKGAVLSTSFRVDAVNAPSKQTKTTHNSGSYAKQLHAIAPHINYDETKYRPDNYKFPIDKLENTQYVSCTDALYFAAENNTCPVPIAGSAAKTVYERARYILRRIITDDMTDVQKAHAIYDWIMWQVTYDTPATNINSGGEAYSAYYLEGVFGDGTLSIDGVKYSPYAVCDGMSKAYSLMCNIEGLPCVRIAGIAGSSLDDAGGHAWNKVNVDGAWYIVDCTWGDYQTAVKLGIGTDEYEVGSHEYFLLTDAEVLGDHFEPYQSGESSIVYAPRTTTKRYSIYEEMTYNGVAIDCEVGASENQLDRIGEIATAFAKAYQPRNTLYVPGGPNDGVYSVSYDGIEVHFKRGVSLTDNEINSAVSAAIKKVRPTATVKTIVSDNTVVMLIK